MQTWWENEVDYLWETRQVVPLRGRKSTNQKPHHPPPPKKTGVFFFFQNDAHLAFWVLSFHFHCLTFSKLAGNAVNQPHSPPGGGLFNGILILEDIGPLSFGTIMYHFEPSIHFSGVFRRVCSWGWPETNNIHMGGKLFNEQNSQGYFVVA